MAKLTWHGHSCFSLHTDDGTRIIIDPWLDENPRADIKSDDIESLDFILLTHGHYDHIADALKLAKRTDATVVSTFELATFMGEEGAKNVHGMNIGGAHRFPFGRVKMTIAHHTGTVHGDRQGKYTANPGGFLLTLNSGTRLYHAGDTALTLDMQLLRGEVDVAILPIGDNFTMGPEDAAKAVGFIEPKVVLPMHYDTFPVIEQDTEEFRRLISGRAELRVLQPGESIDV